MGHGTLTTWQSTQRLAVWQLWVVAYSETWRRSTNISSVAESRTRGRRVLGSSCESGLLSCCSPGTERAARTERRPSVIHLA